MSDPAQAVVFPGRQGTDHGFLTYSDLAIVRASVAAVAPTWTAELNQATPDESTIVVAPEAANDLIGPAFVLRREKGRVRLDQFRWDEYRELGGFATVRDATAAMTARLVPLVSPRPEARHLRP